MNTSPTRILLGSPNACVLTLVASIFLIALFSQACKTDEQRIREANDAAQQSEIGLQSTSTPPPVPTAMTTEISAFDVREGDCFNFTVQPDVQDGIDVEHVLLVECSGQWEVRVIHSLIVDPGSTYPGENYFMGQWNKRCDRRSTYNLFPTVESWELGDRTVNCLQERFDQSKPSDDVVRDSSLVAGECFKDLPDRYGAAVELEACSNASWAWKVLNTFDLPLGGQYPTESYFEQQAENRCSSNSEFYQYPLPETWVYGDRTIQCLVERS